MNLNDDVYTEVRTVCSDSLERSRLAKILRKCHKSAMKSWFSLQKTIRYEYGGDLLNSKTSHANNNMKEMLL